MCSGWAIATHQWVSCKGTRGQSLLLCPAGRCWMDTSAGSWSSSCGTPQPSAGRLRGRRAGMGHHALCRCADHWTPLQCFPPLALLAKRAQKGSRGENGDLPIGHVCRRGQCPAPCAPGRTLGAHEFLKLPGEKESTQSCPQPSKLGQGWGKACWAVSEQGFDSCCMRNCLFSPRRSRRSRSPSGAVVCDISPLSHYLHWGFWTLVMNPGLNNWLLCALTCSGAARSIDGLMPLLRSGGTPPACRFLVWFCVNKRPTAFMVT